MKQTILLFLLIFLVFNSYGQTTSDSLIISSPKGDVKCYQNGVLLTMYDYKEIFKNNPGAMQEFKMARFNYGLGNYLGCIGGFVFGYCLGSAIFGEKVDSSWGATLGVSGAICGTGILIYYGGAKRHRKAISIYNSSLRNAGSNKTGTLQLGSANNGLGLIYKF